MNSSIYINLTATPDAVTATDLYPSLCIVQSLTLHNKAEVSNILLFWGMSVRVPCFLDH